MAGHPCLPLSPQNATKIPLEFTWDSWTRISHCFLLLGSLCGSQRYLDPLDLYCTDDGHVVSSCPPFCVRKRLLNYQVGQDFLRTRSVFFTHCLDQDNAFNKAGVDKFLFKFQTKKCGPLSLTVSPFRSGPEYIFFFPKSGVEKFFQNNPASP